MFFDMFDEEDEDESSTYHPRALGSESSLEMDAEKAVNRWKRVERRIYSPFWRFAHNVVAHPMLAFYRPWGEKLHEWTANKMYEPRDGLSPIVTDND